MNTIHLQFKPRVKKVDLAFDRATSDDQRNRAIDVTLTGQAPGMILSALFACSEALAHDFWNEGDRPALAAAGLMKSSATFSDCQVKFEKSKYSHVKLRNFSFTLGENRSVDITFIARFINLDEASVGHICGLFDELVDVSIESAQMDAFDSKHEGDDDDENG